MKIINGFENKNEINNSNEWFKLCPPEGGEKQWVDFRSAKEMAKFWTNQKCSDEFKEFVRQTFNEFEYGYLIPEYKSNFDNLGKERQHDLLINDKTDKVLITIEGKADEEFGNITFGDYFKDTINTKIQNNNSKALERMINLYQNFFNNEAKSLELKYQLITWFAGSICDAIKADTANFIMMLQEFKSVHTKPENLARNHNDFEKFISLISEGKFEHIENKQIIGPIANKFTDTKHCGIKNLYIGFYSIDL